MPKITFVCLYCNQNIFANTKFGDLYFVCYDCDAGFLLEDYGEGYEADAVYFPALENNGYSLECFKNLDKLNLFHDEENPHKAVIKDIDFPFKDIKPSNAKSIIERFSNIVIFI